MLMAAFIINEARAETKQTTFDSLFLMTVDSKKTFDVMDHIIMMDKYIKIFQIAHCGQELRISILV